MKNNMTTIYIVRHGQSEYNADSEAGGVHIPHRWGEVGGPLSKKGEEQAKKRGEYLKHIYFDAIFSSDLTRAVQTAEIIKLERQLAIQTTKILRERIVYFEGKTQTENDAIMKKALKDLDNKAKMAYKPTSEYESPNESAARILTFLREVAVAYRSKTVLLINHGNNMENVLTHLGYATYDELPEGSIENTGYVVLESDGVDFFVKETQGIHKQSNSKRGW